MSCLQLLDTQDQDSWCPVPALLPTLCRPHPKGPFRISSLDQRDGGQDQQITPVGVKPSGLSGIFYHPLDFEKQQV